MPSQLKNLEKELEKNISKRDERAIPIALFMIESFVSNKVNLNADSLQNSLKDFKPVYEDVIKKGLEEGWMVNDIIYSVKFILRLYESLKNIFELSLGENQEVAINKVVGKNVKELTLKDVDEMLKNTYKK